jgi:hypothetical protein
MAAGRHRIRVCPKGRLSYTKEVGMRRLQPVQFLKNKSLLLSLVTVGPMIVVILGLAACVKHPVGDPEKSKVGPQYSGVWLRKESESEGTFLFMRPYDSRTYLANIFNYEAKGAEIEPTERLDFKAWLTSIGDATFVTMESLSCVHFAGLSEKPPYLVGKMSLEDGELHLRLVNGDKEPAQSANNSDELEKVIAEHVNSDSLYLDELVVFKKTDDKALIKAVLKAFFHED